MPSIRQDGGGDLKQGADLRMRSLPSYIRLIRQKLTVEVS
jgi:hypothetical protein